MRAAASLTPPASPLYLREDEIRRGIELLYFGYTSMVRGADSILADSGFGRAHHRALYFIARRPGLAVGELLRLLAITKQSLGRVLTELQDKGLVEQAIGTADRRQRLLRLTAAGAGLEAALFAELGAGIIDTDDIAHELTRPGGLAMPDTSPPSAQAAAEPCPSSEWRC